jgi:hypothetical protein
MLALATKLRMVIRAEGFSGLASTVVGALKTYDFEIFHKPWAPALAPPATRVEHLTILEAEAALSALRRLRKPDMPSEFFRDEVGAGHCWLAMIGEEPASILWAFPPNSPRPILELAAQDWELTGAYTLEQFRGRGLYRGLIWSAIRSLSAQGQSRFWMVAASANPASSQAILQAGFTKVAVVRRSSLIGPKFKTVNHISA